MCGDHKASPCPKRSRPGPPSHARGPLLEGAAVVVEAGTTSRPGTASVPARDHPRPRGEHANADGNARFYGGPPPTVRGAPTAVSWPTSVPRDHPRPRGDHPGIRPFTKSFTGPTPHARGSLGRMPKHDSHHLGAADAAEVEICRRTWSGNRCCGIRARAHYDPTSASRAACWETGIGKLPVPRAAGGSDRRQDAATRAASSWATSRTTRRFRARPQLWPPIISSWSVPPEASTSSGTSDW